MTVLNNALVLSTIPLVFTQLIEAPIPISTNLRNNTGGSFPGDVYTLLTNSAPAQGVATITSTGLFTFTPITPMTSAVTITYKVCRGSNPLTCSVNTIQINIFSNTLCFLENIDDTLWNYNVSTVGNAPVVAANTFEGTGFPRISNLGGNTGDRYLATPTIPKLSKIRWVVGQETGVSETVNWYIPTAAGSTNQFVAISSTTGGLKTAPREYRLTLRDSNGTVRVYSLGVISPNDLIELEHASVINSSAINASVAGRVNGNPIVFGANLGLGLGFNSTGSVLGFSSRSNIGCLLAMDSNWLLHVTNTPGQPTDLDRQTLDGSVFPSAPFTAIVNTVGTLVLTTPSYATNQVEFGIRSGYGSGILFQWIPTGTAPFVATSYIVGNTLGIAYYNGFSFSTASYTLPTLTGNWVILKQGASAPLVFRENIQLTADTSTIPPNSITNYGFHWDKGLAYYRHK